MARKRQDDDGEHQYPIDEKWRKSVVDALGEERGAQARLARALGCSPGTLNELLKNGKRSHLVPLIHKELGWDPPPMPATGSSDQHEIEVFLKKMGRTGRDIFRDLKVVAEAGDPEKLAAVAAIIAQLAKSSSND